MPTVIELPEDELRTLCDLTHEPDPKTALRFAVREYVRYRKRQELIDHAGTIEMDDAWREMDAAELAEREGPDRKPRP
jgi:hypothetical protein